MNNPSLPQSSEPDLEQIPNFKPDPDDIRDPEAPDLTDLDSPEPDPGTDIVPPALPDPPDRRCLDAACWWPQRCPDPVSGARR